MNGRKRVACFFTGGYTELTAMKLFMKKINPNIDFIQLCPIRGRSNKEQIRNRKTRHTEAIHSLQNGLTGDALINYIKDFIKQSRFQDEEYDAILIEDDKDNRFMDRLPDGTANLNLVEWDLFKDNVEQQLKAVCPDIQIIFFFAAPEVESWFLADWENSFAKIYKDQFNAEENNYFKVVFRKYINDNVLTQRYRNSIESYGYFNGKYNKLSEEIQKALDGADFWKCMLQLEEKTIHYSKRIQGKEMLEEINPEIVFQHCTCFFKEGFTSLQRL